MGIVDGESIVHTQQSVAEKSYPKLVNKIKDLLTDYTPPKLTIPQMSMLQKGFNQHDI